MKAPEYVRKSEVEAILAGRRLTEGQRRTGDAMAELLERAIANAEKHEPCDEDWLDRARDEASCWRTHMHDEDLRGAK